jgi:hypothetical protein
MPAGKTWLNYMASAGAEVSHQAPFCMSGYPRSGLAGVLQGSESRRDY